MFILLFFVILFVLFFITEILIYTDILDNKRDNGYDTYISTRPLKCCILLTMYIGTDISRRLLYENRVNRWLNETNFEIFVIDSSGNYINQINPRLYQYCFEQNSEFSPTNPSIYERDSLLKAFDYFDFKEYDIIFKVTGKYFIPELKNVVKNIPYNTDFVLQNISSNDYQHTEIVGFKIQSIKSVLNLITINITFEMALYEIVQSKKYKCYRLPILKLDAFTERGDGSVLKELYI